MIEKSPVTSFKNQIFQTLKKCLQLRRRRLPRLNEKKIDYPRISYLGQAILDDTRTLEDVKRAIIALFLEISTKDHIIPIWILEKHVNFSSKELLAEAIDDLLHEQLVSAQLNYHQERGIKLTAKGAWRLMFWNWPEPTQKEVILLVV
jgi:hypothetical protein